MGQLSIDFDAVERHGRWVVLGPAERICGQRAVQCRCACGATRAVILANLRNGTSKSCGCLSREKKTIHGNARNREETTPEYQTWVDVVRRGTNTTRPSSKDYVGRGITVCERWRRSFAAFLADVGPRPSAKHSIDRINNDGDYEPGNVRWATRTEQQRNRRSNHVLTFNGKTLCLAEWSEQTGLGPETISMRLKRGWSVERALTEAVVK